MIDQQYNTSEPAIMDYNGRTVIGTYVSGSKTKLFKRQVVNGKVTITAATSFNPVILSYSKNNDKITVTATTSNIDS